MMRHERLMLDGDYPDPTIVRTGRDYYMTYSTGVHGPGLPILHSTDLVHWKTIGHTLQGPARGIAAPELVWHEGLYYLYYPEAGTNWVVTAEHPAGPWSAPVDLHVDLIDPGHVVAPDGTRYIYFTSGYAARLAPDGLALAEALRVVYEGWPYGPQFRTEGFFLESPKFVVRDGWYYLVSAQGGTAGPSTAHMAVVARARHPLGPWENAPNNPLMHTRSREEAWWCKGHATIFEAADGGWYILYHAYEKGMLSRGRKVLLERIGWTEDGWPYVVEGAFELPAVDGVEMDEPSDMFETAALKETWFQWADYPQDRTRCGGGKLVLAGCGDTPGLSHPLTVIAGAHAYEVTVQVTVHGSACAGILLFYDETHFCGVGLRPGHVQLYKHGKVYIALPEHLRRVELRLTNDRDEITYAYRMPGGTWNDIPYACEVSGWHHNALDGYMSLRPGLFAMGEGWAEFERFEVKVLA